MEERIINEIRFRPTGINEYWVSEYGDIINMKNKNLKYMKPMITRDGHKRIELKLGDGKAKKFYIHRLVYSAFIGELIDGLVIEHLDGNPVNNYYKNLKQSTQKENIHTAIKQDRWHNGEKEIKVKDIIENKIYHFDSISKFFDFIDAPQYIKDNGAFSQIKKIKKYDRYIKIDDK